MSKENFKNELKKRFQEIETESQLMVLNKLINQNHEICSKDKSVQKSFRNKINNLNEELRKAIRSYDNFLFSFTTQLMKLEEEISHELIKYEHSKKENKKLISREIFEEAKLEHDATRSLDLHYFMRLRSARIIQRAYRFYKSRVGWRKMQKKGKGKRNAPKQK